MTTCPSPELVTYEWAGRNRGATTWLLTSAAVNVPICARQIRRRVQGCTQEGGLRRLLWPSGLEPWPSNNVNACSLKSRPAGPQVLQVSIVRTALPADGLRSRLLEIRRATHKLDAPIVVFMVPTVHLAAAG